MGRYCFLKHGHGRLEQDLNLVSERRDRRGSRLLLWVGLNEENDMCQTCRGREYGTRDISQIILRIQWQQGCEARQRVCVGRRRSVTQMEKDGWNCSGKALVSKSC